MVAEPFEPVRRADLGHRVGLAARRPLDWPLLHVPGEPVDGGTACRVRVGHSQLPADLDVGPVRRPHWLTSVQTGDGSSGTVSNATSTLMWSTGRVSIAGLPPAAGMISSHAQAGPALVPVTVNVCAFRPADGLL